MEKKVGNITILDVAEAAGVSYSTVSRVLSGYEFVKEATREKVLAAAHQLGYVANLQAKSLAGGKTNIIGLLIPSLDNGYVGEIARGVDEELALAGYDLMVQTTRRNEGKEAEYVSRLARGLAEGLILIVPQINQAYLENLQAENFPYVLIDQSDPHNNSPVVESTNWQGAYEAIEYLIQAGHRRIGIITGWMPLASARERLDAYKAALNDHNIPFNADWVVEGDFFTNSGYAAAEQLLALDERPTAIFASNDLMAFGAMEAIRKQGLDIPADISIIGFDDIPQASLVFPQLTTVRQPLDQMGHIGARMLIDEIEGRAAERVRRVTLATQLIIRDSVKSQRFSAT